MDFYTLQAAKLGLLTSPAPNQSSNLAAILTRRPLRVTFAGGSEHELLWALRFPSPFPAVSLLYDSKVVDQKPHHHHHHLDRWNEP